MRKTPIIKTSKQERYQAKRDFVNNYKSSRGCEMCGWNAHPAGLDLDHLDPKTKYKDKNGNLVSPSTMVSRYTLQVIQVELKKCRVLCRNCHAIFTHTEQREYLATWNS
jgi:hypothetical protein